MGHFLSIIRKQDFSDLLKRGQISLHGYPCIAIDNDIEKMRKDRSAFELLMSNSNEFDYTREYVIIHFTAYITTIPIAIDSVLEVYPLDANGKMDFEISFYGYLKGEPLWPEWTHELMVERAANNSVRGAENIGRIFDLSKEFKHYADEIDAKSIARAMMKLVYDGKMAKGGVSFWLYVLTYQRYGMFPKGKPNGYFMDAYHTLYNYLENRQLDAEYIERLPIFSLLERFANNKTSEILKHLPDNDKEFSRWESIPAPNISEHLNILAVVVLFFTFLDTYRGGLTKDCLEDKQIKASLEHRDYKAAASFALFLLGLKLGYEKTRSCLYDSIKIPLIYGKSDSSSFQDSLATAGQNQKSDHICDSETQSASCEQSQAIEEPVLTSDESIEGGNPELTSAQPLGIKDLSVENNDTSETSLNPSATQSVPASDTSSNSKTSNDIITNSDAATNSSVDSEDSASIQKSKSISSEICTTSNDQREHRSNHAQQTTIPFGTEELAPEGPSNPLKKKVSKPKR